MKNLYRLTLLSLIFLSSLSTLYAQDEKYDAPYLSVVKEYTMNADGSMEYRYVKEQKLQTYRSFHNLYGETFIVYNPLFQKLKINESYTIMADGKKVITPANAFNEVLPGFAANAPAFSSLREMVVTHTGLERNSTIFLDYTLHTNKDAVPVLHGNELLAEVEPVKTLIMRIRVPENLELYYRVLGAEISPSITKEGNVKVYTWQLKDLPAYSTEEHQPFDKALVPRLIFSTTNRFSTALSYITEQPAFRLETTNTMNSEVLSWCREITDPLEKVLKIQENVVNHVRLISIPFRYTGYKCRTAEQVWNSNYGTGIEKTLLLTALLNAANVEAKPTFIVLKDQFDENIGTLSSIYDFGVKVNLKEAGTFYISATSLNAKSLDERSTKFLLITYEPSLKYSESTSKEDKGQVKLFATFIVSSDPIITGEITVSLDGASYPWLDVLRDKNSIKKSMLGSATGKAITGIKESKVTRESLFQTFSIQTDKPWRNDSGFFFFTLPEIATGIESWHIKTLSMKRVTPFEVPSKISESQHYSFTLPVGIVLFTPLQKIEINNKAGSFLFETKYDGGKVVLKRQINIEKRVFSGDGYFELKALLDYWNNPRFRELIFRAEKQ